MEFLVITILIIATLIYIASKNNSKESVDYDISINGRTFNSDTTDYEDSWDDYELPKLEAIFEAEFPLFFALKKEIDFVSELDNKYHEMIRLLSKQKDENILHAINQLMYQDKYKKTTGLPQYLQVIPVKSFIANGIFVTPTNDDLEQLLNSMTMDILKKRCVDFGMRPAKSKKDTIEKLRNEDFDSIIDYSEYFKLNPIVREIYDRFGDYCQLMNEKQLQLKKLRLKNVQRQLDPDELNDEQTVNFYKLQEYGYDSLVYFKHGRPLFRIMGTSLRSWNDSALLLDHGKVLISEKSAIDRWTTIKISIIDETKTVLFKHYVKDMSSNDISQIDGKSIIYIHLHENRYWFLNFKTYEYKILENPDNLDVYTLVNNEFVS